MTDKEARRARRQEIIRERRRAIKALRKTGMSDDEIAKAVGGLIDVEGEEDVLDAEIVSIDESEPEPIDVQSQPMVRAAKTRAVVSLRPVGPSETGRETTEPVKWSEEWWETVAPGTGHRRCKGHSTRHGGPCRQLAMKGTTVCKNHGGLAPQVKQAARMRLEMAADRMAAHLLRLGTDAESESVQLGATNSALDGVGISKPAEVVVSPAAPKPWEEVFESIGTSSRAESRARRGLSEGEFDVLRRRLGDSGLDRSANGLDVSLDDYADTDLDDAEYDDQPYTDTSGYDGNLYTPDGGLNARERHGFDSPTDRPGPRRFGREMTAEDAVAAVNRANARAGALRAIESPHKRYLRP